MITGKLFMREEPSHAQACQSLSLSLSLPLPESLSLTLAIAGTLKNHITLSLIHRNPAAQLQASL